MATLQRSRGYFGQMLRLGTIPVVGMSLACAATSGLARPERVPLSAQAPAACQETPRGKVTLPADDGAHGVPIEWWYWTGHLKTATGRWFGFEEVFFRGSVWGLPAKMAHFAITDIDGKQFRYKSVEGFGLLHAPQGGFDLSAGAIGARGGGGADRLHGELEGYGLDLDLQAMKAPVLQHGGYTEYPIGGYTYYYSRERLSASGTISVGGEKLPVTGTAWFDHQWGDLRNAVDKGWDWYALQLDDGRELMLFEVRDRQGTLLFMGGSLTDSQCRKTEIEPGTYRITPLGTWKSPSSGCTYPMGWRIEVQDLALEVKPVLEQQELRDSGGVYWEGAATVSGSATGRAYIEMTQRCAP